MKYKVGQKVYCKRYKQYGIIVDDNYHEYYPIIVKFDSKRFGRYTIDSKIYLINPLKDKLNKLLNL